MTTAAARYRPGIIGVTLLFDEMSVRQPRCVPSSYYLDSISVSVARGTYRLGHSHAGSIRHRGRTAEGVRNRAKCEREATRNGGTPWTATQLAITAAVPVTGHPRLIGGFVNYYPDRPACAVSAVGGFPVRAPCRCLSAALRSATSAAVRDVRVISANGRCARLTGPAAGGSGLVGTSAVRSTSGRRRFGLPATANTARSVLIERKW